MALKAATLPAQRMICLLYTSRDKESKDKNLIISNIRSRVSDIFVRARLKNETLTKESFFRPVSYTHLVPTLQ